MEGPRPDKRLYSFKLLLPGLLSICSEGCVFTVKLQLPRRLAPILSFAHALFQAVEQIDLVQSGTLAQFRDLDASAAWSGLCWSASCPHTSRGAFAYRACVPLLAFGCCRSRCGHGCFPNGYAHPGECRRWQDDRGSFLRRISGQVPVPFPWSARCRLHLWGQS